jgi:hypothetical protein
MFGPRLNVDGRFPPLEDAIADALGVVTGELARIAPGAAPKRRYDAGIGLWAAAHGLASLVLVGRIRLKDSHVARYVDALFRPMVAGLITELAS